MHHAVRAALLILPIALLPAALVACGGGSALSLEDYFAEVRDLRAAREEKQDDIDGEYEDKLNASEFSDQVVEDYASYFEQSRATAQDFVDEMKDLEPPDEVAGTHDDALAAYDSCLEETGKLLDEIRDAESFDDLLVMFESESVNEACDRSAKACEDLQAIADENEVEVDLSCSDD